MDTVGIIGAMDEEIETLIREYNLSKTFEWGGNVFFTGEYGSFLLVLMKSGIGKVNAAIGTTLLISRYDPMCLINTGSAGAIHADLDVGDVIISSDVIHHDVDATSFGYAMGQIPQMPDAFLPHSVLVSMAEEAARDIPEIRVRTGTVVTGDSFIGDRERKDTIQTNFPAAAVAEMEAAAIAQTCHRFRKSFVIIRSVSDRADGEAAVSFEEFLRTAADHSARLVKGIVERLARYVPEKEADRLKDILAIRSRNGET